jgi:beta-glucanase (GH16 family)
MWRNLQARLCTALLLLGVAACQEGHPPQTSSSSNWLVCETDADCANLPAPATCGSDGYCVSTGGQKVELVVSYETEFEGDALDTSVFGFETGTALRNDDEQAYTERAENAFVSDGELVLVARAESYEAAAYTSASLETRGKRAFTFGRIEAEMSLPTGTGVGPSFWMLPDEPGPAEQSCSGDTCMDSTWPIWGDVVIASLRSEAPTLVYSGINYAREVEGSGLLQEHSIAAGSLEPNGTGEYHVYRLDWTPQRMDWFIDDEPAHGVDLTDPAIYHPGGENPFHRSFHLKLTLPVGGLSEAPVPDVYPQEMRVRWLRVSQYR